MKRSPLMHVFALAVVMLIVVTPAVSQTLNADGVRKIHVGKVWAEKGLGNLYSETFWEWAANGSVCVRLFEKTGTCDYVGSWEINADRVCYKLDKWDGKAVDASRCVRITGPTTGQYRYKALDDNNVQVFRFTVLD